MSGVTSHVLDTAEGLPAVGMEVTLAAKFGDEWADLGTRVTDEGGRTGGLWPEGEAVRPGTYRLRFATADYHAVQGQAGFYPYIDVVFTIWEESEDYHVPLLLSPFGYSTYRGS
jgi:5-hydroxyisourate hydrolase